jgi:hypothetical protein
MMQLRHKVGRLGEARIAPPVTSDEVFRFGVQARQLFATVGRLLVFCTDARALGVLPADIAERIVSMMRADNAAVERNAVLVAPSTVMGLQLERMVREAGHPGRRVFRDAATLVGWLGEALIAEERAELQRFLDESPP